MQYVYVFLNNLTLIGKHETSAAAVGSIMVP